MALVKLAFSLVASHSLTFFPQIFTTLYRNARRTHTSAAEKPRTPASSTSVPEPSTALVKISPAMANLAAAINAKRIPYRETAKECRLPPPANAPRSDDVHAPLHNHQRPFQKYFCDVIGQPYVTPRFQRIKCCIEPGPRRPRRAPKADSAGSGGSLCSANKDATCQPNGAGGKDVCKKLTFPECSACRDPATCFEVREADLCVRIEPPTLSFHDCLRSPVVGEPPSQCSCHADKLPPCEPTPRRPLADR